MKHQVLHNATLPASRQQPSVSCANLTASRPPSAKPQGESGSWSGATSRFMVNTLALQRVVAPYADRPEAEAPVTPRHSEKMLVQFGDYDYGPFLPGPILHGITTKRPCVQLPVLELCRVCHDWRPRCSQPIGSAR